MDDTRIMLRSAELGDAAEWGKYCKEIPVIKFPPHWKVRIVPPFMGAMIRFNVSTDNTKEEISVYLDCHDILGCFGEPYWEVYPFNDDVGRTAMANTDELIKMVEMSLSKEAKEQ